VDHQHERFALFRRARAISNVLQGARALGPVNTKPQRFDN